MTTVMAMESAVGGIRHGSSILGLSAKLANFRLRAIGQSTGRKHGLRLLRFFLIAVVAAVPACGLGGAETVESNPQEIALPSAVDHIIRAGNGDLLLLQMNNLSKLAVYDIRTDSITGYIPLGGSDALVAGMADRVILIARDKNVMQSWALRPLEKKLSVSVDLTDTLDSIAAGYASVQPFMVMTRQGPRFFNPDTLKQIQVEPSDHISNWTPHPQYPISVAASADGTTFTGWVFGLSPGGLRTLRLQGNKVITKYEHASVGIQIPSADGSCIYTSDGVYTSDLKPLLPGQNVRYLTFPSVHPAYYMRVTGYGHNEKTSFSICSTRENTALVTFDKLPGITSVQFPINADVLPMCDRITLHPVAKKMVILSEDRTRLYVVPFDVIQVLNERGVDYLYVESLPVTTITDGKPYEYAIRVMSKAGQVKYILDAGPEGMTLSPEGVLRWEVPKTFHEKQTSVIVTITDASNQSVFHSFPLTLPDALAKGTETSTVTSNSNTQIEPPPARNISETTRGPSPPPHTPSQATSSRSIGQTKLIAVIALVVSVVSLLGSILGLVVAIVAMRKARTPN